MPTESLGAIVGRQAVDISNLNDIDTSNMETLKVGSPAWWKRLVWLDLQVPGPAADVFVGLAPGQPRNNGFQPLDETRTPVAVGKR